jgi:excisionase family DNA binding protein
MNSNTNAECFSAYLTKCEAAKYLKVSTRFLERAINDGRLRAYKPSLKIVRFRRSELDSFMSSVATAFLCPNSDKES